MLKSPVMAVVLFALLAGCGGGGGGTSGSSIMPHAAQPAQPAQPMSINVRIVLPSQQNTTPAYVSPNTESAGIVVTPQGGSAMPVAVANCSSGICSTTVVAPSGSDSFAVSLYSAANATGNVLSTGTVVQTIVPGTANSVNIAFDGVPASVAITLTPATVIVGTASSVAIGITAQDASGATITGTYSTPITLTDSDSSGSTALSASAVSSSSDAVTLVYNGSHAFSGATIAAVVQGASPSTVTLESAANPTQGTSYTVNGCPMFPGTAGGTTGGWFNTNVTGVAPDPNSAAYTASYAAVSNTGFMVDMPPADYENFVDASGAPPQNITTSTHSPNYEPWAMPWGVQTDGHSPMQLEEAGIDGHYTTLATDSCTLWEAGSTTYTETSPPATTPGTFDVYNSGRWDTTKPFSPSLEGGATGDAAGIPLTALAITPEQIASGVIGHALGWGAVGCEGTIPVNEFESVPPAAEGGDCGAYSGPSGMTPMPYGSHIRLKASVNISRWSAGAKMIAVALQQYGAYMYDTGCCNEFYAVRDMAGPNGPAITANDNADLATLTITDFDVIPPSESDAP